MDRGSARTFVSLKLEDPNQERFTPTQYNDAIDLGEEQFALDTRAILEEDTLTVVDGEAEIALPTNFLVATLVRHKGLKLRPITKAELAFQSGVDWTTINGTPRAFYIDEEDEKIGLFPKPQAEDAGAYLVLNFAATPTAISADGTVLLNAKALLAIYHPAIVAYAAYWMLGYLPSTPEIQMKRSSLLAEYSEYRDRAIDTYKNMADEPIQMKGGRDWNEQIIKSRSNAFDV